MLNFDIFNLMNLYIQNAFLDIIECIARAMYFHCKTMKYVTISLEFVPKVVLTGILDNIVTTVRILKNSEK